MVVDLLFIGLSLLLLFAGAESLVRGSASLALRAGLSPLLVGLTIVAFGTSSPELVVSVEAALSGQGDISVGNVIGSNSFNIAVILGLTALVCPIPVHRQIIRVDAPIALGVAVIMTLLLLDGTVSRVQGICLVAGLVAYLWMNVKLSRKQPELAAAEPVEVPGTGVSRHWGLDLALIIIGLAILVLGSRLLVEHAVSLARDLGVSEAVIGLTIVSAGTSMPELATSLVAAFRKQVDIAVGNVIGSNIFNILGILGLASIVTPITAPGIGWLDYGAMLLFSALIIPLLYTGRMLHRVEGAALLLLYGGYLALLWPTA